MLGKQLQTAAAGNAGGDVLGVEDVFSTWLYTGNTSTQTITNGIDLAGEGGMVWIKGRFTQAHHIGDTERGHSKALNSASTAAESTNTTALLSFDSDGFTLGNGSSTTNFSAAAGGGDYASWTFRKAEKFFDVVTYAGDGTSNRQIAHNLGSTPGAIIVKNTSSSTFGWYVWHRSLNSNQELYLNTSSAATSNGSFTAVTSTYFSPVNNAAMNGSGSNYVAYFFAHDAGGFGDSGNDSVVNCGSFTTNVGGAIPNVTIGWEPQWLLVKMSGAGSSWFILDNMRGVVTGGSNDNYLLANSSNSEVSNSDVVDFTSTGFTGGTSGPFNANSAGVYIAIRRGPMKKPEDATKVFTASAPYSGVYTTTTNFPADAAIVKSNSSALDWFMMSRLTGDSKYLKTNSTTAETTSAGAFKIDSNTIFTQNLVVYEPVNYIFRRAPGFFDVATYTGTGVAPNNISHNLGVVPELIIARGRSASNWMTYHSALGATKYLLLQANTAAYTNSSAWDDTEPTASQFTVGNSSNTSGAQYVAYLFATLPGISKVGSYTGTGTTLDVDCGFTAGARFVLIKRTDTRIDGQTYDTDWYVWDTARGIVSGPDPHLALNTNAYRVIVDYIDPLSSGFQISSTAPAAINANGGSYIFLAIA
jgi:hypothetical protein